MEKSHKVALGIMTGVIIGLLLVIIAIQYDEANKIKIQAAYDNGFIDGYAKGKENTQKEILSILKNKNEQLKNYN